ncbi:MAG: hypothetical protein ACRDKT_09330 [Actinomycetota bacterium]
MMKRSFGIVLAFALALTAFGAPATAKKKPKKTTRVAESNYEAPAIGIAPPGTGVCFRPTNSCGDIATGATEKYLKVEIVDATGLPVAFSLGQDTDPDTFGTEKDLGQFCGNTGKKAIAIEPGLAIVVFPWAVGVECGSIATQGTVTATLSNLP